MSRDVAGAAWIPILKPRPADVVILLVDLVCDIEVLEFVV
jgi:hypothetical protein